MENIVDDSILSAIAHIENAKYDIKEDQQNATSEDQFDTYQNLIDDLDGIIEDLDGIKKQYNYEF